MTEAEQAELCELVAGGDEDARKRLVEAHLQLVVVIAKDYAKRDSELPDLIEEGNLGLIHAAGKLDEMPPEMAFAEFVTEGIKRSIEDRLSAG